MMINFMERPYEYYLNADTAVIQRNITSDVNNMYGLILALLQLTSECIVFVCLAVVSLVADVWMSITVTVLLVVVLLVIKCILKPIMKKAGEENQDFYSGLYKWIDQSVMGIKEIKIANKENYFINEYAKCGAGYVSAVQRYNLYNATPRLLIETVAIAGMVLYMMVQLLNGAGVVDIMPQITLLAMVAMRLIPCANRIQKPLQDARRRTAEMQHRVFTCHRYRLLEVAGGRGQRTGKGGLTAEQAQRAICAQRHCARHGQVAGAGLEEVSGEDKRRRARR